jgi:pyruvate dehydrogenase E2 component (dihydrolipoamide acetyltransferase)
MPSLGADMTEGRLLEWLVHPGDAVHRGDLVAVVKTDKADVEVEIFDDGVIGELLVPEGDDILEVGAALATVVDAGVPAPAAATAPTPLPAAPPVAAPPVAAPPVAAPPVAAPPVAAPPVAAPLPIAPIARGGEDRIAASPYARRHAAALGIDLANIAAAQPGHPITAADVDRAASSSPGMAGAPRTPVDQADAMRKAIGRLMARSKREIPHYYLDEDIELTAALAWLERHNEQAPVAERILPAALFYKAVAGAAAAHPELNGFWIDDKFEPGSGVHLGIAISLRGGGLVAPAVHDADRLSLTELMVALRDLTARARGGRGSEMTDATITVTNLGDRGVRTVFGVIYPPQVALVGFGKVSERVWDVDNGLGIRPAVTATLSADHRATDGHIGAGFLADVARRLHHPEEL